MRVIYISKYISYGKYGLETRHIYLSREMVKRGYKVQVISSTSNHNLLSHPKDEEEIDGVKVKWISGFRYNKAYGLGRIWSWIQFEWRLRKYLKTIDLNNKDILITSSLSLLTAINGLWAKKKYGLQWIFEVRDIWPLILKDKLLKPSNLIYRWLLGIEQKSYTMADIVVGTMPNLGEHVYNSAATSKPVLWIPHLVNPSVHYLPSSTISQKVSNIRQDGTTIIGYAGSFNKSSALEYLLNAADQFKKKKVHLVLMGDGPMSEELRSKYNSDNVHFFDKQPQENVLSFLEQCDFLYDGYLKLEVYKYGNSRNKYVEYTLAKKPILLAYEGYPLFVSEYNCGLVVTPESTSAIVEGVKTLLALDEEERLKYGQNAYTFALGNLQIDSHVDSLIGALQKNV